MTRKERNTTSARNRQTLTQPKPAKAEKLLVPVMPRNPFKFDPVDLWMEHFAIAATALSEALQMHNPRRNDTNAVEISIAAGEYADAALRVAEERWGREKK